MFIDIKLMNKIRILKNIHIEIEKEYMEYVKKFIPESDFEYRNIDLSEKDYIQKNFFSILMLMILEFNNVKYLKSHGLIIHSIRNIITNTDNIIDNENKGNLDIKKLQQPALKNIMSLLIANKILDTELHKICKTGERESIKEKLLKSIYEIAKGEEIRKINGTGIMTCSEVINKIHTKIGGELLAISMTVPIEIYKKESLSQFKDALFEIGLSLQLLDDTADIQEDFCAYTQNAFYSYLIESRISDDRINNFIETGHMSEDIEKIYEKIIEAAVIQALNGFKIFERNGLEIGFKEGLALMKFMFKNRKMEKEWIIFEKNFKNKGEL